MSEKSYPFLQKLSINDNNVDLSRVISLAYTEQVDLSGPSIILMLRDEQSSIRDELGLAEGSTVVMEMGDVHGVGNELFEETFIVSSFPIKNDVITIEGFQKDCHEIKIPAGQSLFFTDMQPKAILAKLLPSLKIECTVSGKGTYHLNQGKSPSRLLRDMARDYGATCWICRGTVYFKPYSEIINGEPLLKMGLNSVDADMEISRFNKINNSAYFERVAHKNYSSWTTTDGYRRSATHNNKPSVLLAYPTAPIQLSNQCLYMQPILDVVTLGDSRFKPSSGIELEIIKLSGDAAIDESVEARMFIKAVTHYSESSKYNNRTILGIPNGAK